MFVSIKPHIYTYKHVFNILLALNVEKIVF